MSISSWTPSVDRLPEVLDALAAWQDLNASVQLHPGDLGWHWRFGADTVARSVRVWSKKGTVQAVGFVDGGALRMGIAPSADADEELAQQIAADVGDPSQGILPTGEVTIEARSGAALHAVLGEQRYDRDDPWTPLVRDLGAPVRTEDLRVEAVGDDRAEDRVAVHRAAFGPRSTFTAERWHSMADGVPYTQARCLVGYGDQGEPAAAVTVWAAGPGRAGLIEPMGVDPAHRGTGYGRAITVAGAAALREMGASTAIVATPSANTGAVATYRSAGFAALPEVEDFVRAATV